jgi:hypothetical protein
VLIPEALNGPAASANGGYACGSVARFIDGPAEVTLRAPVPLGRELGVSIDDDGSVVLRDGEELLAEGRAADGVDLAVPDPVGLDEARRASERYVGAEMPETFHNCFVCGVARPDALGVFAGEAEGRGLVASPWVPPEWTALQGVVRDEIVWAVLDCPTYYATTLDGTRPLSMLGRLAAELIAPIDQGASHVVVGWPLGKEGRKHHAGSAILTAEGRVCARARALLIELRDSGVPQPADG